MPRYKQEEQTSGKQSRVSSVAFPPSTPSSFPEAYIPFSAFFTFPILHFNISLRIPHVDSISWDFYAMRICGNDCE